MFHVLLKSTSDKKDVETQHSGSEVAIKYIQSFFMLVVVTICDMI